MKPNKRCTYIQIFLIVFSMSISSCDDDPCDGAVEKVMLANKDHFIPYTRNEQLKFLHNNLDTHIFIGVKKENYFIRDGGNTEGTCAKDYESVRVSFLNTSTNEPLSLAYQRNMELFPSIVDNNSDNAHTYYIFDYKGKIFTSIFKSTGYDPVVINNISYTGITYIGVDTNNCFLRKSRVGIVRIRIKGENWDLIP